MGQKDLGVQRPRKSVYRTFLQAKLVSQERAKCSFDPNGLLLAEEKRGRLENSQLLSCKIKMPSFRL